MIRKLTIAAISAALLLSGCTGPSRPTGTSKAGGGTSPTPEPTGSSLSGPPGETASEDMEPEPGLYRIDLTTGATEPILTGPWEPREPERSPDGSRLVFQATNARDGIPQIFVLEDGQARHLTYLPGGAMEATWSPDGTQIAFAGAMTKKRDSDIFVVDADGDDHDVRLLAGTDGYDRRPDWSPDGSGIVFDNYGEIWVASVPDGTLTRLPLTPRPGVSYPPDRHGWAADPTWSPDGRWIAFTRFDPSTINGLVHIVRLWMVRSDGTDERPLRENWKKSYYLQLDPSWSPDGSSIAFAGTQTNPVLFARSGVLPSDIGILDIRTGEVAYVPIPLRAWDLSWDAKGLIASVGDRAPPSPPFTFVTNPNTQDPWPAAGG